MLVDRRLDAPLEALGELDHPGERILGQHVLERGAHCRERQDVCGERAADAADVRVVTADRRLDAFRDLLAEA